MGIDRKFLNFARQLFYWHRRDKTAHLEISSKFDTARLTIVARATFHFRLFDLLNRPCSAARINAATRLFISFAILFEL